MVQNFTSIGLAPQRRARSRAVNISTGFACTVAALMLTAPRASAQTFNGTTVTQGPFYSGTQIFNHGSKLDASSPWAVGGGTQTFNQLSTLDASAANAVGGGEQFFYDSSSLNASAGNAVSFGKQRFFNTSALNATAATAISGGTQYFNNSAALNATAANAISGGTQYFDNSAALNATAANAISGGTQYFDSSAALNATAANAIRGGLQIFSGNSTLDASSANAISGGSRSFYGNSKLNASSANAISGGSSWFADSSILNASAANAFNAGELVFQDSSQLNATAAHAISGGDLRFFKDSTLDLSAANAVSGGLVTLFDNATVHVRATNALSGASLRANGGTLALNGYSTRIGSIYATAGNIMNGGASDASLTIDSSGHGNSYIYTPITDGGAGKLGLVKTGTGKLGLSGNHTYTGPTVIDGGELFIGGSIASSSKTTVRLGGRLAGDGTVGTTVVEGEIAPTSIAKLKVNGDLTFSPSGSYLLEARPASKASSSIAVTGTAVLNGAEVRHLNVGGGIYNTSSIYTILRAGAISGRFGNVTESLAFLDAKLAYSATEVSMTLDRNDVKFAAVANTRNQTGAGSAAESLGSGNTVHDAILSLDAAQARDAFDALSGSFHASAKSAMIEDSRFVRNAAMDRVRAAFQETVSPAQAFSSQFVGWGQAFGSWGDSAGDGMRLSRKTSGVLTGIDGLLLDAWRVGVLTGYSRSDLDGLGASGTSENAHLGLYGGTQWAALGLRGGTAYTWHDMETKRDVIFPEFSEHLTSDDDGGTAQVFGEVSYRFDERVSLEPFAGVAHVSLHSGYNEAGGTSALTGRSSDANVTFSTLGIRGSFDFELAGFNATAHGLAGWRHAFGDTTPLERHAFSSGAEFTVEGLPIAEDTALLEAGLELVVTDQAALNIFYSGQFSHDAQDHGVQASLNVRF